ncbi:hypothetical protein FH972_014155 [Carpinus fangiana]|uniref:Uncharacterized protein n=1 Tax=Carpinus fangiana TaxID=176857 RepID=A0A5N6RBJ9_9ROSI|nr:hypothetical protein FH972_014155 [Carpinus fangiana]
MVRRRGSRRRREAESNCRESQEIEREREPRVRESPARLRGSSDLMTTRVGGAVTAHKCTTVGDWEWRPTHGRLGIKVYHARVKHSLTAG